MTTTQAPAHRLAINSATEVIARIPRIGKLMIIAKRNGVTHERIGVVERIAQDGAYVRFEGLAHDSQLDPSLIRSMVIDTSSILQEKVYPRIDFNGADGQPVFSLVGFGGLDPFEAALEGLAMTADPDTPPKPPRTERAELSPKDAGLPPLQAALASGGEISIIFEQPGFCQRWQGVVSKVSPAMGFINVMTETFHLHLLGATVGSWETEASGDAVTLHARDTQGARTGLRLYAKTAATFAAPVVEVTSA